MIDPKMIPDEAWEAAMKTDPRDGLRAAIAAALNAWPGVDVAHFLPRGRFIMLPAPYESKTPKGDA